jgi:hypothetical protein
MACLGHKDWNSDGIGIGEYNDDSDCYWSATCWGENYATVHFTRFDTESNYDYVTICESIASIMLVLVVLTIYLHLVIR